MKPSRAAILASFVVFTPLSLAYRRAIRSRTSAASANRAFLVIGAGEIAANFYKAYRQSPNQQRLEFVDMDRKRVGQNIAGAGSPLIEGDLFSKLSEASKRYSGIILAEGIHHIRQRTGRSADSDAVPADPGLHVGIVLRSPLALCAAALDRSVLAVATRVSTFPGVAVSLHQAVVRYGGGVVRTGPAVSGDAGDRILDSANERAAGDFQAVPGRPRRCPVHGLQIPDDADSGTSRK